MNDRFTKKDKVTTNSKPGFNKKTPKSYSATLNKAIW